VRRKFYIGMTLERRIECRELKRRNKVLDDWIQK